MSPDDAAVLDAYRFGRLALSFVQGTAWSTFESDVRTQQATLHALTLMGEAVKRLTPEFRFAHPDVNWSDIAGLRDVLIHAYHRVDLAEIWVILEDHLPALVEYLEPLIQSE